MTQYDGPVAGHGTAVQRLVPTVTVTGGYLAHVGELVLCDATTATFTVTLPAAPLDGSPVGARLVAAASGNTVTLACGGTDAFGAQSGATTIVLRGADEGMAFQYSAATGTWHVTANTSSLSGSDTRYLGGAAALALVFGG